MADEYGYSLIRCGEHGVEWFAGFNLKGEPLFADTAVNAQIWESRLHAETQALLLGCQQKAVRVPLWPRDLAQILGDAIDKAKEQ